MRALRIALVSAVIGFGCSAVQAQSCGDASSDLFSGITYSVEPVVDLQGNLLIGYETEIDGAPVVTIAKYQTSGDTSELLWTHEFPAWVEVFDIATDVDGFIYVSRYGPIWQGQWAGLSKLTPDGGLIWTWQDEPTGRPVDLEVGPEGIPVMTTEFRVYQINAYLGVLEWGQIIFSPASITIDSDGDVFAALERRSIPDDIPSLWLFKFSGASGDQLWLRQQVVEEPQPKGIPGPEFVPHFELDPSGDLVVARGPGALSQIWKLSGDTGDIMVQWPADGGTGSFNMQDMALDRQGAIYTIVGPTNVSGEHCISKFDPATLTETWFSCFGAPSQYGDVLIALDRADQSYAVFRYFDQGRIPAMRIEKRTPEGGAPVCTQDVVFTDSAFATGELKLAIDAGGTIFAAASTDLGGTLVQVQQDVITPTVSTASPHLALENFSLWAPGVGAIEAEDNFFEQAWGFNESFGGGFSIWLLGDFGGGVTLASSGSAGFGYKAEINTGSVDVHLPLDVSWTVPGKPIAPGGTVSIDVGLEFDPAAQLTSCVAPQFNAGITGGLDASLFASAYLVAFDSTIFNSTLVDVGFGLEQDYLVSLNALRDGLGIPESGEWFHFESDSIAVPGLYLPGFEITVRSPQLSAASCFDPQTLAFASSVQDPFIEMEANFTDLIVDIIQGLHPPPHPLNNLELDVAYDNGNLSFELAALQLLAICTLTANQDLTMTVTPKVRYEFSDGLDDVVMNLEDMTTFEFDIPAPGGTAGSSDCCTPGGNGTPGCDDTDCMDAVCGIDFFCCNWFWDNVCANLAQEICGVCQAAPPTEVAGVVTVTPHVYAEATFQNATGTSIIPGVRWETLRASASASAGGYGLFSFNDCLLCAEADIEVPLELFNDTWAITLPEVELAPFKVSVLDDTAPVLGAASRATLPLILYDQTSPSVTSFNVAANGESTFLLYGANFTLKGINELPTAYISHHGRTEALLTTVLNPNTLLVDVPNRFRLLPGVARLWVERVDGFGTVESSATLDLPITYPKPRLDAVNPNLWAADPSLNDVPVQVIDRKTLLGTDTFIARRDYYIKMRDELWTGTFAGGVPADVYFPGFDFNQLPGFPAVLFDYADDEVGPLPIPRFVQPIDSGIHNVRLAEHNYDRPGLVDVVLCNPGPGGGASETLVLNIAAPVPVATQLVPAEVEPGSDGFELVVRGPANVPTWPGYEEPKAGNFNAASVVRFNGFDLDTRFVSSFELRAVVPAKMVGQAGTAIVTVFTDGNDSVYFEQLIEGQGPEDCCVPHGSPGCDSKACQEAVCAADPFCCDEEWDQGCADSAIELCADDCEDGIIFQGNLDSGGESAPLFLTVAYRQPAIDLISPPETCAGNPAFDLEEVVDPPKDYYNLSVTGRDFREGAVVLVDGAPRATFFVSRELLQVRLEKDDVASEGERLIFVQHTDGDISEPVFLFITEPCDP